MIIELNDRSFDAFIKEGVSLIMLTASWCKRCKAGIDMMEELRAEFPELKLAKLDLQMNPRILMRYAPNGIPHFLLFKENELIIRQKGIEPNRIYERLHTL